MSTSGIFVASSATMRADHASYAPYGASATEWALEMNDRRTILGRRPGFAGRLLLAQALVLVAGASTLWGVAAAEEPGPCHGAVARKRAPT